MAITIEIHVYRHSPQSIYCYSINTLQSKMHSNSFRESCNFVWSTKCVHAPKFKSYAAPLNFSVCVHASSMVGNFNFARFCKTAAFC